MGEQRNGWCLNWKAMVAASARSGIGGRGFSQRGGCWARAVSSSPMNASPVQLAT
jgi:hypothetical protein